jgi:sortase A
VKRRARIVAVLLLLAGGGLLGRDAWLAAKGALAEVLIAQAFAAHLEDGARHRPWDWADTWPIARLGVERLGVRRFVLSGATGGSLAFGIGHVDGSAAPNETGNCVLAGHRDSWARFLLRVRIGDRLQLTSHGGRGEYVVRETRVVDRNDAGVLAPTRDGRLTLLTCWPFDGLVGGPLRYAVICERVGRLTPTASGCDRAAPRPSESPACSPA